MSHWTAEEEQLARRDGWGRGELALAGECLSGWWRQRGRRRDTALAVAPHRSRPDGDPLCDAVDGYAAMGYDGYIEGGGNKTDRGAGSGVTEINQISRGPSADLTIPIYCLRRWNHICS
jgi:hypothetical protein